MDSGTQTSRPKIVRVRQQINRRLEFPTRLGWMRIEHFEGTIKSTKFGFPTKSELGRSHPPKGSSVARPDAMERSWIDWFQAYAEGSRRSFSPIEIDVSWMTPFQLNVISACRKIPYGQTVTYGQLASLAGSPRAARAVGSAMSNNRYPIIVPCHRVVASSHIGGFSAPKGTELKLQLLQLEGAAGY